MRQKVSGAALLVVSLLAIIWDRSNGQPKTSPTDWAANNPELEPVSLVPGSVYDGDTIRVIDGNGEELKVRFACIDAPEKQQARGEAARSNLQETLDRATQLYLHRQTTDRYGRVVAEVWGDFPEWDLVLVQMLQAEQGYVFPYERYAEDCPSWSAVEMAGAEARSKSLGVWSDAEPEYPWDWRRR